MEKENTIFIGGVEYVPKESPIEFTDNPPMGSGRPDFDLGQVDPSKDNPVGVPPNPFWKSPRFWMIGVASVGSVLVRDDFAILPWNMIVGQIIGLWGTGAASFGLFDRTVDKATR